MERPGDSEQTMRAAIASYDWESSRLGAPTSWPSTLHTILNLVLDTSFPMLIMWGPDLIQVYNAGYVAIFGDKHPRSLGQPAAECWADIWDDVGPLLMGVYERGRAVYMENMPLKMERGGAYEDAYFTFSYSPIRDAETVVGVICVVSETTAHVLRERETIERAEALAEIDRAKTQFFNNISHEFRTPLTLMLGPLEDLVRTLPEYGAREKADLARRNAVRLHKLVNSLLDFSAAQSGLAAAEREPIDIDALTADLISEFRSAYERAGLMLDFRGGVGATVPLDPVMYEKVVLNLVSNALKFTFSGGVAVTTERDGQEVVLCVRDTGTGIAEKDLPRLFERFTRVSGARSRTHEGTGIGLALVNEIVILHGGRIDVESTVGVGTTFIVRFPTSAPQRSERSLVETRTLRRGFREEAAALVRDETLAVRPARVPDAPHVLLADDNADLRGYLGRLLDARYAVTTAVDGADLLERVAVLRPDLIVADIMMPNVDGFEAVRRLRESPETAEIPIILLSARAGEEASAEALDRGADDYIVKPFVATDLIARIDALLRRRSSTDVGTAKRNHADLFAGITDRFIAAVDTKAVWTAVTSVLTPGFADWSVVYVPDAQGTFVAVSIAHAEPAKIELGEMIEREFPYRVNDGSAQATVFATRAPLLIPRVDPGFVEMLQRDTRHGDVLRALNLRSLIMVPILTNGEPVAILGVVRSENPAAYDASDLEFLERIAVRCGLAFESARARERERTVAAVLQRALLPAALPAVDGLRFSAAYTPAAREHLVGGDWYDAFTLADGRVFVSIGDVVGHGLAAATVMGSLRQAARGFALEGRSPGDVLSGLNRLLCAERETRLATAYLAAIDPQTLRIAVATAGHFSAIRLTETEMETDLLYAEGLLLGADPQAEYQTRTYRLSPGDVVTLFTDGFVENDRDIIEGERRFIEALRRNTKSADPATAVHLELYGGAAPRDDAALLVMVAEPHLHAVDVTIPATPEAASYGRTALRRFLDGVPLGSDRRFELLVAAGEAMINAIEHGSRGTVDGKIRLLASRVRGDVVIEIDDAGRWSPTATTAQRGYGLPLMHAYADTVEIERGRDGTRVRLAAACNARDSYG